MSYRHITAFERGQIEYFWKQDWSKAAIGRELGRHRTTISRELKRNGVVSRYKARQAEELYRYRRQACRPKGKLSYEPLREKIAAYIVEGKLGPKLASDKLKALFPLQPRMHVCHESIYQAIYTEGHYLDFVRPELPQARPKRRKRGQGKTRRGPQIPDRVSIALRPAIVETRTEAGHWEGDLIVGKGRDGYILTLVERVLRILRAVKLTTKHAWEVRQAVVRLLQDEDRSLLKTITFDNGTEFTEHRGMSEQLGMDIYFADPYSPGQRGANEQVNGLIRRYLPKNTPFAPLTDGRLWTIVNNINDRPRECLELRSPNEALELLLGEKNRALRT